jgi:hypothetical protein
MLPDAGVGRREAQARRVGLEKPRPSGRARVGARPRVSERGAASRRRPLQAHELPLERVGRTPADTEEAAVDAEEVVRQALCRVRCYAA